WLGIKNVADLIELAKQKPNELSYGVNGIGRLTHLTGELLQRQAGIKLLMVPYTGGTPAIINDMMGKRVGVVFEAYSGLAGAIDAGNVVPLARSRVEPDAILANVADVGGRLDRFR